MAESVIVSTPAGKRDLAEWLKQHDPQTLQAMIDIASAFGNAQSVEISHQQIGMIKRHLAQRMADRSPVG